MKNYILILVLLLAGISFGQQEKKASEDGSITCVLVQKAFVSKKNITTDIMEYYLQCSIQDYFIKLCESEVTGSDLEKYIDQGITVHMEIREGLWDECEDNMHVQSRMGKYVIIKSIVE